MSKGLPPNLHPATLGSHRLLTGDGSKLLIFVANEKTTPFAPILNECMGRAKSMHAQWNRVIDRVRNAAQTNPAFRGDRLVASAVGTLSDRMQYSVGLRDAALACFDNVQPLGEYMTEMASAEQAIAGFHDVMLRQVMIYSVKPLKDYTTLHYPRLVQTYADLEKKRIQYDNARNKKSPILQISKQQLLEQAGVMQTLIDAIPEYQLQGAKAIDTFVRAEHQFMKETLSVVKAVRRPENKQRWRT